MAAIFSFSGRMSRNAESLFFYSFEKLTAIAMAATANGSSIRYTRHRFTASRFLFFPSKETFFFYYSILSDYIFFSTLI
jgi:hypothetical protein